MAKIVKAIREHNIIFIVTAMILFFYMMNPRFLTAENISAITRQIVPIGFMVIGQFFIVVSGNIDLSMGMVSVLLSIVIGVIFGITGNIPLGILCVLVVSLLIGFINGYIVSKKNIPSFIVTLSILFIATGLSGIIIPRGQMIFLRDPFFKFLGAAKLFGIYYSFLMLLVLFVFAYIAYNHSKIGAYIIAIGDNEKNAKLAGINTDRVKIIIFMFSGFCCGLSGIVISSRMGFVQPGLDGIGMLLDAITAVIVGGTLLQGGKGTVGGVFWGLIFIGIISNSLNLLNVQDVWHQVFKGLVIIAALGLNWLLAREGKSHFG